MLDVAELLKHVAFDETHPNIMLGKLQEDGLERIYKSPAPDFELSQISIANGDQYQSISKTAQILIVIQGKVQIHEGETILQLGKGETVFLTATSDYKISSSSSAIIYKATAP